MVAYDKTAVEKLARKMIRQARRTNRSVYGEFNGIGIYVVPTSTVAGITRRYEVSLEQRVLPKFD